MAFDLTAADPLMKIYFNPRIVKQFNTAAVLFNRVGVGKGTPISNRGLEIPIHTGPNAAFAWYTDGGTLPAGGGQLLNRALVGFQSFALAVQFTGAALDAAGDDAVTYARALAFNIKNATLDAVKYLNIYSFLDGSGTLATLATVVAVNNGAQATLDVTGSADAGRYLRPGMQVDILTGASGAPRNNQPVTILSVSTPIAFATSPATITVSYPTGATNFSTASGDAVVMTGSANRVIAGLKLMFDDGTLSNIFQNVNRTQVVQYKSNLVALTGTPALARDHLRRSLAVIQIARGAVDLNALEIWSHPAQLHAYADMGWTLKRFNGSSDKKLELGYTAFEWEGVPWIIDTDMPKDHLFFVDQSSLFKVVARELSFDDRTGSILRQVPSSTAGQYTDAFVAFLLARLNLGCYAPNANTKVNGLAIPSGY